MPKGTNDIKNYEDNIKNYSSQITSLENFIEAARKFPGMYLSGIGNRGYISMIREVLNNVFDEIMRADSPCNRGWVHYDERTNQTIISDNGRGIPYDKIIDIFTREHTSSNYNKKKGEYTSGRHGVGAKITNALSSEFIVESYILGEAKRVHFKDGNPVNGVEIIPNPGRQGTIISFVPSYEIMGNITVTVEDVLGLVQMLLPLSKIGAIIEFSGVKKDGTKLSQTLVNEDGIISYLIMKTTSPIIKPIIISHDNGTMKVEAAFTYDSNDLQVEDIESFANFCPTPIGTHREGLIDGVCNFFRMYMNKIYLANKKLAVVNNDIKTGLKAIISAAHIEPIFVGQAKNELGNEDMFYFVKDIVNSSLEQWSRENPNDLQKICKYFKEVAEIRVKSEEGKVKLSTKYEASATSGLPKKYERPIGNEHLEFVIVEGDSAGGSAKNRRCKYRQGIMPIRGKIPNAFATEKTKFLSHEEVAGMIVILNSGYGKSCDPKKCPFEKIIFMPDADPDGAHIRSLLLRFFLLYLLPLLEAGLVYAALPPLYGITKGKKTQYFIEKIDFLRYIQKQFSKNNEIMTINNTHMAMNEIIDILYSNMDYTYNLETISNRYAINPYLLEMVAMNIDKPFDTIRDMVRNQYRFMDVYKEKNTIIVKGLIESKHQRMFLNDKLIYDMKDIVQDLRNNSQLYYKINGQTHSLYGMMKAFESNTPSGLTRYKGLGEMNADQLAESTLHPDSDRTLFQYTVQDAKQEIETIRYLESNKSEFTKGIKVSRFDIYG